MAFSTAGLTCSGLILENGGRSVMLSRGFDIENPYPVVFPNNIGELSMIGWATTYNVDAVVKNQ
jgi:hypothetical protein